MMRSWKIGTAFGIPVYVHPTFLLAPVLVVLLNGGGGGLAGVLFLVAMCLAVFGCVLLHEFGHALMARHFGIKTRDVTLYPIGGVARLEGMSEKPYQEILIALAGPAVNVAIAILLTPFVFLAIATGVLNLTTFAVPLSGGPLAVLANFALLLWYSNIVLLLFNLIPAFPMDGGRVLRALLSSHLGLVRGTELAARIGAVLIFVIAAIWAFNGNFMLPFLALFVVAAGQQELLAVRRREAMRQAQLQMAPLFAPLAVSEPPPVARAVEVAAPAPTPEQPPRAAEPQLIFHFRVVEVPETPR
jgi:Zn-dependent protease